MLFTQSLLWGKKGLFRKTGISKLSVEQRQKELKVRNVMLKSHQVIGYLTLAGMVAQGIMGGRLYNGETQLYDAQKIYEIINCLFYWSRNVTFYSTPIN